MVIQRNKLILHMIGLGGLFSWKRGYACIFRPQSPSAAQMTCYKRIRP